MQLINETKNDRIIWYSSIKEGHLTYVFATLSLLHSNYPVPFNLLIIALMMETIRASETSLSFHQTVRGNIS